MTTLFKFWQSQSARRILFLMIIGLAAIIRLAALGSRPQQFNQDEMLLGYDAWSLWQTGRDHHGELLPINFRAFNDYVPPVGTYLAAPFVGLFGLSEATTRLPFALMGIGAVALTGWLGRRWFGDAVGLLAALLLAVDPWAVNYSRIAFPASGIPFFTSLALVAFTHALDPLNTRWTSRAWLGLSALSFALLTGTYPTMKIEAPLLFGVCLVAGFARLRTRRALLIAWLGLYLVLISPLALTQLAQWQTVQTHYNSISIFNSPNWLAESLRLYLNHFDLARLAFGGFNGGVSVRMPIVVGEVFWLEIPLWIVAFISLVRRPFNQNAPNLRLLILLWLLVYPIADSLTRGDSSTAVIGLPHEIRSLNILPLPELLAAYGALVLWNWLDFRNVTLQRLTRTLFTFGVALLLSTFTALSLGYYFNPSPAKPPPYNVGLRPALEAVLADAKPCDNIWLQTGNQTYMYYLFLTRYPPQRAQTFDLTHVNGSGVLEIAGFDRMSFSEPDKNSPIPPAHPQCAGQDQRAYYVTQSDQPWPGWQELITVRDDQGILFWRALKK